jgi:phosphatidylserine decarboxylase
LYRSLENLSTPFEAAGSALPGAASAPHPEHLLDADRRRLTFTWAARELSLVSGISAGLLIGLLLLAQWSLLWLIPATLVLGLGTFLIAFFRNPRRVIPRAPGLIVSPADGTVTDIERVGEADFLGEPALRIGIFLSLFDVHVNRAPACGRVEWLRRREGAFHDARSEAARSDNEAQDIGIIRDDEGGPPSVRLLVRQIAGAIARRIVCPLETGMSLDRGGLIGMIKFGSRTELYIPESSGAEIRVGVGSRVKGGSTVIAAWR